MNTIRLLAFAASTMVSGLVLATNHTPVAPAATAASAQPSAQMTEGEVRKVDMDAKKITLRHGEIKNLEMPSMTMVFQVKDPAMLDKLKAGDKVRFSAEKINGAITLTGIESAK